MAITKKNDAEGNSFWKPAENARIKVESWPAWKRNLKVTQHSVKNGSRSSESSESSSESACKRDS